MKEALPLNSNLSYFETTPMCRQTLVHVISSEGEAGVERSKTLENVT